MCMQVRHILRSAGYSYRGRSSLRPDRVKERPSLDKELTLLRLEGERLCRRTWLAWKDGVARRAAMALVSVLRPEKTAEAEARLEEARLDGRRGEKQLRGCVYVSCRMEVFFGRVSVQLGVFGRRQESGLARSIAQWEETALERGDLAADLGPQGPQMIKEYFASVDSMTALTKAMLLSHLYCASKEVTLTLTLTSTAPRRR